MLIAMVVRIVEHVMPVLHVPIATCAVNVTIVIVVNSVSHAATALIAEHQCSALIVRIATTAPNV